MSALRQALLDALAEPALLEAPDGSIAAVNAAFRSRFSNADAPTAAEAVARALGEPGIAPREGRHTLPGGGAVTVTTAVVPEPVGGRIWRLRDAPSDRWQSAGLRSFFEQSPDAIAVADDRGRVVAFNPAAERMFGWPREDAVGKSMAPLIMPERFRAAHEAGMARLRDHGQARVLGKRIALTGQRASGEEFPVEVTILRVEGGGEPRFWGVIRDQTEHDREREAEQAARDEAVASADELRAALVSLHAACDGPLRRAGARAAHDELTLAAELHGRAAAGPVESFREAWDALRAEVEGAGSPLHGRVRLWPPPVTPATAGALGPLVAPALRQALRGLAAAAPHAEIEVRVHATGGDDGLEVRFEADRALAAGVDPLPQTARVALERAGARIDTSGRRVTLQLAGSTRAAPAAPAAPPPAAVPTETVWVDADMLPLVDAFVADHRAEAAAHAGSTDLKAIASWGHRLKGSGTSYGFPELTRLGAALEERARAADVESVPRMIAALAAYLADLRWAAQGDPSG